MHTEFLIGNLGLKLCDWLTGASSLEAASLPPWAKSVQMRAAFSQFKAAWGLLTANLSPCLVATGVPPTHPFRKPHQWPAHSIYGPRGGTARLDGRSKRQFHIWRALSPCRERAASLSVLPWIPCGGRWRCPLLLPPTTSFLCMRRASSVGDTSAPLNSSPTLSSPDVSSSACHPNMAEGRDGVQCRGLWMVGLGYKRWTGSTRGL